MKVTNLKKTEVIARFDDDLELVLVVPVEVKRLSNLQALKCRHKDTIKIACLEGDMKHALKLIDSVARRYADIVRDYLTELKDKLGKNKVVFTDNNSLLTFDCGTYFKRIWYNINNLNDSNMETVEK